MPSSQPNDSSSDRPAGLSDADSILLLAMLAWGGKSVNRSDEGSSAGTPPSRLFDRLEPSRSQRLTEAWNHLFQAMSSDGIKPGSARRKLADTHSATMQVDPFRVHPSWWVRALREESPAVQRIVAASAPERIRDSVQIGLLLDNDDLRTDRMPEPHVRDWVMSLWSERLVGGSLDRDDDSSAVRILTVFSTRTGYRICRYAGLAKLALAGQVANDQDTSAGYRGRAEWLREQLAPAGPEFAAVARHDVKSLQGSKFPRRRQAARLGLLTIARLLTDCEPFRLRWALQHWPYTIAKLLRSLMAPEGKRSPVVAHVESRVLKTAWERLNLEGALSTSWPGNE